MILLVHPHEIAEIVESLTYGWVLRAKQRDLSFERGSIEVFGFLVAAQFAKRACQVILDERPGQGIWIRIAGESGEGLAVVCFSLVVVRKCLV